MKKYISIFTITALLLSLFAGFGGAALAAGTGVLDMPDSVEANVGDTVNLTADITNDTGDSFLGYRILLGTTVKYDTDATLLVGDTASDISISFTATQEIIDAPYISFGLEYKTSTSGDAWVQGDVATVHVNKKELSISVAASLTPSLTMFEPDDQIQLKFKVENNGEADLSNILIIVPEINSGKALNQNNPLSVPSGSGKPVEWSYTYKPTATVTLNPYLKFSAEGKTETQEFHGMAPVTITEADRKVHADFTVDNAHPDPNEEVTLTLHIVNEGNVSYKSLTVTYNGEKQDFPSNKLDAGADLTKNYTMSFEVSTDITFIVTVVDFKNDTISFEKTVSILLPVDSDAIQQGLSLKVSVDRPAITAAGTITFSGTIVNDSNFKLTDVAVTETAVGSVYTASEMEMQSSQSFSKTVNIDATTTYNFVLTVKDRNGKLYTVNADPITVSVLTAEPSPTDISSGAPDVSGTDLENDLPSDPRVIWYIIAGILFVLIIGVGAALLILWRGGGKPRGGRTSSGIKYKSSTKRPPSKSKTYRDRNNF